MLNPAGAAVDLMIAKPNCSGFDRFSQEENIDEGSTYYHIVGDKLTEYVLHNQDQLFTPADFKKKYEHEYYRTWKAQLNVKLNKYKQYTNGLRSNDVLGTMIKATDY